MYEDFFDGRIAKEILGHDDLPFFRNGDQLNTAPDNELRVGVSLGVDWYVGRVEIGLTLTEITGSHICAAKLLHHIRRGRCP